MSAPLPVGVVGVGSLGRHHARHLAAFHGVQLIGVYDLDRGRAAEVAAEVGTRAFAELDDLLREVEAVSVAVATSAHAEVGLRALEAGIPVLMEKPLAVTLEEADATDRHGGAQGRAAPGRPHRALQPRHPLGAGALSRTSGISRAPVSRRSRCEAPTWPWCST